MDILGKSVVTGVSIISLGRVFVLPMLEICSSSTQFFDCIAMEKRYLCGHNHARLAFRCFFFPCAHVVVLKDMQKGPDIELLGGKRFVCVSRFVMELGSSSTPYSVLHENVTVFLCTFN